MGKLNKLARNSKVMEVKIRYDGEIFKFNLGYELQVKELSLNSDIKSQPQAYSFLLMLHKKLISKKKMLDNDRREAYAKLFTKIQSKSTSGRAPSIESVRLQVEKVPEYRELNKALLKAEEDCDTIEACVKGFEMRANLIQTLSSNLRKEKN